MIRKYLAICVLLVAAVCAAGCDFLRNVAGRPVSEDLEVLRSQAELKMLREKAVMDSLAVLEKHRADSLEAVRFFASEDAPVMVSAARLKGLDLSAFDSRYLIVLGSFSQPQNAEIFGKKVSDAGYETAVLSYNYGTRIVGVCPTGDIFELMQCWLKVKKEQFFPENAWIMIKD